MESRNYEVHFLLRLMAKDLAYAETEASQQGVDLTTARVARGLFDAAVDAGYGDTEISSVIDL